MKHTRHLLMTALSVAVLAVVPPASAEKKAPDAKATNDAAAINVVVTARPMRPSAVVDLGQILPEIELSKLRKDFYTEIEGLLLSEPF